MRLFGVEVRKPSERGAGNAPRRGAPLLLASSQGGLQVWSGRRALCFAMIACGAGWAVILAVLWRLFG